MWNFSFYKVIQILLPFRRRTQRFIAWMKTAMSYLDMVYLALIEFREKTLKEAKMTPQVYYLEKYLNSRFGVVAIHIVEGFELGPWIFYTIPTGGDVDLFMVEPDNYLYSNEVSISVDFVVEVPSALEQQCNLIAAMVQKFKLAGKSFIIQII